MISNFRRSVNQVNNQPSKFKGGQRKNVWFERFKLPQNTPTPFIFIKGEYQDPQNPNQKNMYFRFRKHRAKIMKGGRENFPDEVCSAGWDAHNPQPCAGCLAMDQGQKHVTVSDFFAFGIVHLANYHGHPYIEQATGQKKMRQDGQGPVLIYDECEGRTCNYCKVLEGKQPVVKPGEQWAGWQATEITTIFGHRRYMEIGKGHLGDLDGWDRMVMGSCGTCSAQLITDSFNCPDCGTVAIDMATDSRNDEQIANAVMQPYPCLSCKKQVYLKEIVSCDSCKEPKQNSLTDVVLHGMRQGDGKNSKLVLQKVENIADFEKRMKGALGGKTIAEVSADLGKVYEFDQILAPRDLASQVKRLELVGVNVPTGHSAPPTTFIAPQMTPPAMSFSGPPGVQGFPGQLPPQFATYPQDTSSVGPSPFVPPPLPHFGNK